MTKLSIILPCYNVVKQIERCLASVYKQDIPESDYELIVVNDGSTDESLTLVKAFQKIHSNIEIIEHEVNKGLGAARNTGLKKANAKYIWFVDSDDYVDVNCLGRILKITDIEKPDVLSFKFYNQNSDLKFVLDSVNPESETKVIDGKTFLDLHYQPSTFSSCSKIYNKDYLIANQLYFAEGVYWEDADIVVKAFYYASRVKFIPKHLYYYCYNEESISRTGNGKKYADMVKMGARKLAFANSIEKESPDLALKIKADAAWNATTVKKILLLNSTERSHFYHLLEEPQYAAIKTEVKSSFFRFLYHYPKLTGLLLFFASPFINRIKKIRD